MLQCYYKPISLHYVFKWPEEILLEAKVSEFPFLQELHRELSQRVDSEECYVFISDAAHLQSEI